MADLVLKADTGRELGTRPSRRLRREGRVPGVLYGLEAEPVSVTVEFAELRRVLTTEASLNAMIQLEVEGQRHLSYVKEIQRHPVRDEVLHVDFLRVDPKQELAVEVPIVLEGEAKAVTDLSGMVDQTMFALAVYARPDSIPNELTVDVSELQINESIRVGDIALPDGVRTEVDAEEPVAVGTVTRSTLEMMAAAEGGDDAEAADGDGADADAEGGDDAAADEA